MFLPDILSRSFSLSPWSSDAVASTKDMTSTTCLDTSMTQQYPANPCTGVLGHSPPTVYVTPLATTTLTSCIDILKSTITTTLTVAQATVTSISEITKLSTLTEYITSPITVYESTRTIIDHTTATLRSNTTYTTTSNLLATATKYLTVTTTTTSTEYITTPIMTPTTRATASIDVVTLLFAKI
jgi:hypothetical protein